jgi:predicted TIM-barrel fold metal-dependent hydrolase
MNASEFLSIGLSKISDDPFSRLNKVSKSLLKEPDCIIDIHAHIFDKKCLTVGYILLRLLKSKIMAKIGLELLEDSLLNMEEDEIYNGIKDKKLGNKTDWQKFENEIQEYSDLMESEELFGFNLKDALSVLKKQNMLEVFDYYIDNFSILKIPGFKERPFVTCILLMDLETGWGIKPEKKLFTQIVEIKDILLHRPIIPFFPLDPRRADHSNPHENLYELFLNAFTDPQTPFFGVKCYPGLGYLPSDIRLDPIFMICEKKNIPVLSHCGGEIVSTFDKSIQVRDSTGDIEFIIPGGTRIERAKFLTNPEMWIPVLDKYNGLKLDFGHFGGDLNWENHTATGKNNRVKKILEMMKNPHWKVFADFSYNVVERNLFNAFEKELNNNPDLTNKIMFGTDYWVVLPSGDLLDMQHEFLEQMKDHQSTLLHSAPLNYLTS